MNQIQKQQILGLINHIANNELKKANGALESIVNEKIKQRIAVANKKLESQK